ncbi:MAG: histone deacetylase [Solirubrobacterales bacterium]|nr:histone deacetylase [Solirubrobacterales bacterium]
MPAAPVLLHHPASLHHETGQHPEQPARMVAIARELEARDWLGWERVASPEVRRADLLAVHPERHLEAIEAAVARARDGRAHIDLDTVVSAGSLPAGLHAAGGAVALVDRLLDGAAPTGFSLHRPPGHHAETARAMGFCLFNSVAVAARHALAVRGLARVLVVDWDVHHGNGTEEIFSADPAVLYLSIHQSPLYPGTGPASEVGSGAGRGFTVNLPVPARSGDDVFVSLVRDVAVPLARSFAPQLVLLSAGFDAHAEDPLANCEVTEAGYAAMAALMREFGEELAAPVGAVLEGGYALGALGRSVAATMGALAGGGAPDVDGVAVSELARAARGRLAEYWPGL